MTKFFFTISPDGEYVVDKPLPKMGLTVVGVYICIFIPTHKGVGISWSNLSAHGRTSDLEVIFTMEVEVVAFEDLFKKFEKVAVEGSISRTSCIVKTATLLIWDVGI